MLEKTFNFKDQEKILYTQWENSTAFACDPQSTKTPYTIMMPPPNVTGSLHLGHALTYTLQDVLVRFKRLCGYDVLWQPGTDHAGIATQMVVERQLLEQGTSRQDLGREAFIERVWQWKEQSGNTITHQQRRLGISPDWSRERFTLDEELSQAVTKVFVEFYRKKLIYRDKRLVNWDTKLQTAISDVEVITREIKGYLWYIHYPLVGNPQEFITVATTRPETLFGDTAVAVHPEDPRYQHLIGRTAHLPLTQRTIPIIADTYCQIDKGSGAVKITPGHDFNDFEVGKRHSLDIINIMDAQGHLNENVPEPYQRLNLEKARTQVLQDLEAQGLLEKTESIIQSLPYGDRSGVVIQPWLTDQWFVDAKTLAQPAIKAVEKGDTSFVPQQWAATYFEWLRNIQPWCISRQLWWGHQVPAWYDDDGNIFVAETAAEAQAQAGQGVNLTRDADVLDTWFSSGLWPFSTLGWPQQTPELQRYYPTDVLVTGFDIIFFWVARMMMMGLHFTGKIPFKHVYMHALVRDEQGQKMSKSKGNIIDPLEILSKFGCDAVRMTLTALAAPGRDIKLGEARIEGYRNFVTKLWNAARFLQMNGCGERPTLVLDEVLHPVNRWILAETSQLAIDVSNSLENFRFDEATRKIYHFLWGTYCDWYLEFIKPAEATTSPMQANRGFSEEDFRKLSSTDSTFTDLNFQTLPIGATTNITDTQTKQVAVWVFTEFLKIAHPFIPFVTESLWQSFAPKDGLLMVQRWEEGYYDSPSSRKAMDETIDIISQVRSIRAEFNIPPTIKLHLSTTVTLIDKFVNQKAAICRMAGLSDFAANKPADKAITFLSYDYPFSLHVGEHINIDVEIKRLEREIDQHNQDIKQYQKKLDNPEFCMKAKLEVVEEIKERLEVCQTAKKYKEMRLQQLK